MADVTGKAQLRYLADNVQSDPRAIQGTTAVNLEAALQAALGNDFSGSAKEIHLLAERPAIIAGQDIDLARFQFSGPLQLQAQVLQMHVRSVALYRQYRGRGEQRGDVGDVEFAEQSSIGTALRSCFGDTGFQAIEASGEQFVNCLLPGGT